MKGERKMDKAYWVKWIRAAAVRGQNRGADGHCNGGHGCRYGGRELEDGGQRLGALRRTQSADQRGGTAGAEGRVMCQYDETKGRVFLNKHRETWPFFSCQVRVNF